MCGTADAIPEEELDGRHHLVLPVPHKGKLAVTEKTQIPFLELLGLRQEIGAYIGDPQWISSPCLNQMITSADGSVDVVFNADDPYNSTTNQLLVDSYLTENPDALVIGGPFGNANGDRTIIAAATQERTTVATFDWIGYYATFFNLEAKSNEIAAQTKDRFDCATSNAIALSAARETKPKVLWATYFAGYNWSVAECPMWNSAYYCEYAQHCGADLLSRPEGFGWNDQSFGGAFWYLDDDQLLEVCAH